MKNDYLRECLAEVTAKAKTSIPIDQFNLEFCKYCQNIECQRAGANNRLFENRARNWFNILFQDVHRLPEDDSTAKKIISKWTPKPVEVSSQSDAPVEVEEKTDPNFANPFLDENVTHTAENAELSDSPEEQYANESPPKVVVQQPIINRPEQLTPSTVNPTINTPFNKPKYVATPENEVVIESGGTFTFGE